MWHILLGLLGLLKSSSWESTCQKDGSNVHVLAHINTTLGQTRHVGLGNDLKPPRNLGESGSCHVGLERSETAVACVKHLKITTRLPDRVDVWNKKRNFVFWESCGEDWGFTFPGTTLAANSNFDAVNGQRVFPYGLKKHHLLGPTPKASFHVLRM